jgi:hypothetical protein
MTAMTETTLPPTDPTVTLSDGRTLTLRAPRAGQLRGVKLLDVLQLDTGACAPVLERITDLSAAEFYALGAADALVLMTALVGFFAPSATPASPPPSTTASN